MDFEVEKVDFSVSEFFESFGHNLPKIVVVTQGFFGEIVDDTFDKCQVYRIHTVSRQKRIIAKASDRHYSIPLNYPLKVCVVKKHGKLGKEQTLKDIVTDHAFPVDVKFAKDQEFDVGASTTSANRFPQLKLIDVFDEVYFLANTIIDGVIDLRVVPIPLYLSMLRLAEITGIKDQTLEKWKRYTFELTELVTQAVEFDLTYGNKDIAVYNEDAIQADAVYTYIEPRTYSNIFSVNQFQPTRGPTVTRRKATENPGNVYEEIQKPERPISDVIKPINEIGGELKSFFESKKRASVTGRPVPTVPDTSAENKETKPPDIPKRDQGTHTTTSPVVPPKPNPYANEIPRGTVVPTTKGVPGNQRVPPLPSSPKPNRVKAVPDKTTAAKPTPAQSVIKIDNKAEKKNGDDSNKATHTFKVESLSIRELADCMRQLNLADYISLFEEHMVDGAILKELDVEILKTDFGFKGIEAIRMMKFAREGHIPK